MGRVAIAAIVCIGLSAAAFATTGNVISQQGKVFSPGEVTIATGSVLRIANDDEVLHHVYIESPTLNFDSGEQEPGRTVAIRFDRPGTYVAKCAIHPKMHLNVIVQ
jgi:plastocyanin